MNTKTVTTLILTLLAVPALAADVTYRNDIKPLFKAQCAECHGDDAPTLADFKLDEEKYKKEKLGPRTSTYETLIQLIAYPDTGALMRRLDDGSSTADQKPGNMYKNLGETDAERAKNLATIKAWVGEGAWNLNRWGKKGTCLLLPKNNWTKSKPNIDPDSKNMGRDQLSCTLQCLKQLKYRRVPYFVRISTLFDYPHTLSDRANQFVSNRARSVGNFFHRQPTTPKGNGGADAHIGHVGDVRAEHIHGHTPHGLSALAIYHDRRAARCMAGIAIRIAASDDCDGHGFVGGEGVAIADMVTGLQVLQGDHFRSQSHHGQQTHRIRRLFQPEGRNAIEHDAGARPATVGLLVAQDGSGIGQAHLVRTARGGFVKSRELFIYPALAFCRICIGKVRHERDGAQRTRGFQRGERGIESLWRKAQTVHAGVELEVNRNLRGERNRHEHLYLLETMHHWRELIFGKQRQLFCAENTFEQQDGVTETGFAQGNGIGNIEERKAVGHITQRTGHPQAAVAVSIGFDNRPQLRT